MVIRRQADVHSAVACAGAGRGRRRLNGRHEHDANVDQLILVERRGLKAELLAEEVGDLSGQLIAAATRS